MFRLNSRGKIACCVIVLSLLLSGFKVRDKARFFDSPDDLYVVEKILGIGGMGTVVMLRKIQGSPLSLDVIAVKIDRSGLAETDFATTISDIAREQVKSPPKNLLRIYEPRNLIFFDENSSGRYAGYPAEVAEQTIEESVSNLPCRNGAKCNEAELKELIRFALKLEVDIGNGLLELGGYNYIHRDVKFPNIFWLKERLILGDLDSSIKIGTIDTLQFSTQTYAAPEIFQKKLLTPLSDYYSLAACVFKVLIGQAPAEIYLDSQRAQFRRKNPRRPGESDQQWEKRFIETVMKQVAKSRSAHAAIEDLTKKSLQDFVARNQVTGKHAIDLNHLVDFIVGGMQYYPEARFRYLMEKIPDHPLLDFYRKTTPPQNSWFYHTCDWLAKMMRR